MDLAISRIVPGRAGRGRFGVGLVASVGLVLSVAACGGAKEDTGSGTDEDPAAFAEAEIEVMKICEMVSLAPLLKTMKSKFEVGPTDIGKGVGVDPAGPQCEGQIDLPKLRVSSTGTAVPTANARFNMAALPYHSAEYAAGEYDTRVQQVHKHLNVRKTDTPLAGEWTKGVLINGRDLATNRVYALVQKDSYLLKIEMSWETDDQTSGKFPFTRDDIAAAFRTMMTPFHKAVSAKAEE